MEADRGAKLRNMSAWPVEHFNREQNGATISRFDSVADQLTESIYCRSRGHREGGFFELMVQFGATKLEHTEIPLKLDCSLLHGRGTCVLVQISRLGRQEIGQLAN
jgi:hypothetical protein